MNTETTDITTKTKRTGGKQPKTQASKAKDAVKIRRAKIIKALIAGKTQQEAGIIAGFAAPSAYKQVSATLQHPAMQSTFLQKLEAAGLGDSYQVELFRKLTQAKKYLPARGEDEGSGAIKGYHETDDAAAIAKAIDIAHKLAGRYIERTEIDMKQPISINIKKFCTRTNTKTAEGEK